MTAREKRAIQFMPFDALHGFYDLVLAQERSKEPRREVGEDEAQEISDTLLSLERGMLVRVRYYDRDAYVTKTGMTAEVDPVFRQLNVAGTRIRFQDIYRIERI